MKIFETDSIQFNSISTWFGKRKNISQRSNNITPLIFHWHPTIESRKKLYSLSLSPSLPLPPCKSDGSPPSTFTLLVLLCVLYHGLSVNLWLFRGSVFHFCGFFPPPLLQNQRIVSLFLSELCKGVEIQWRYCVLECEASYVSAVAWKT